MKFNKFIIKGFLLAIFAFAANSCTDLYDTNYSEVIPGEYEFSDSDIGGLVSAGYTSYREILLLWNGYWRVQENCADEIITPPRPNGWVDGGIYQRMHRHTWTTDDDIVYQTWTRTYSGIASCNIIISQIEDGTIELGDATSTMVSELKVLRASYYYILCDMYGNVPLDTIYTEDEDYLPTYNTRQEVYNFIVKEIEGNIDNLSEDVGGEYYNRFNQWSARTILAKTYLNAEVYTGTAQWQECLDQCNAVINSGGYSLESDQKSVFASENESSSEIIFGIAIDPSYTDDWNTFDIHMQTLQPACQETYQLSATPWGGMCAIPQFIDTFDPDDKRLTKNFISGQQYDYYGDTLLCTLGDSTGQPMHFENVVEPVDNVSSECHGYRFQKFEIANGSSNILENDYPYLRYADVLMMKAECLLRMGDADAAATIVTEVRTRAFDDASKATVTGDELKEGSCYEYGLRDEGTLGTTNEGGDDIEYGRFLDELAWEFNQEGRRRTDMIRFGAFTTKSFLSHQAQEDDHTNLYPIPLSAIEANSNLKQNTGY